MRLRDYQSQAVAATWDYMRSRPGNPAIVVPTGGGKSVIIADTVRQAVEQWGARVGVVAGQKELLAQNADKMRSLLPGCDFGIYSASLRRRDRWNQVMFLQVQSVYDKMDVFGKFDLLLFDEFHLVPTRGEGRYRTMIEGARRLSPNLRCVGYSATPFRMGVGPVCGPGHIFNEVAYEVNVGDLIGQGYLCPLISKGGSARADLTNVKTRSGGDYVESELAAAVDRSELIEAACDEMVAHAADRHSWIVFAVSVQHAEHVADALRRRNVGADVVHGGTPPAERDQLLADFQKGRIRALVNVNVLTTGFDAPNIDCVVMLRPTKSAGLYVQMVGRGFRKHESKADTLVLDFAGNILEFGPVDQVRVKAQRDGTKKVETVPHKECPKCHALMAFGVRTCPDCGHVFSTGAPDHLDRPVNAPVLSTERERVINTHRVDSVKYSRHMGKGGKPDSLRVTYQCGLRRISEWVCLEHGGTARTRALEWWIRRDPVNAPPRTVEEALGRAYALPVASSIQVDETDKYPQVIGHEMPAVVAEKPAPEADLGRAPDWLKNALRAA